MTMQQDVFEHRLAAVVQELEPELLQRTRERRAQRREQPASPKPLLLDYLLAAALALQLFGIGVSFLVAASYDAYHWWAFRTATGVPLMLMTGALLHHSLKRRDA